jgi:putative transposase
MNRSYKYRIYPTPQQERRLFRMLWMSRKIYNRSLALWKNAYERKGLRLNYYDLQRHAYRVRSRQYNFLPSNIMICTTQRRLDKAIRAFYRRVEAHEEEEGFPKFKPRRRWNSLEATAGVAARIKDGRLILTRVGRVRVWWHRAIPKDAKIKYAIVSVKNGRWYVVLQTEEPERAPVKQLPTRAIGIDLGIKYALALSDGTIMTAPKPLLQALGKLKRLQRKLDRQRRANNPQNYNADGTVRKGRLRWNRSTRQMQTERQIARLHEHIANARLDWWHKITFALVKQYDAFVLEDINTEFMRKNKKLARVAHDIAWSTGLSILEYKAETLGLPVVRVRAAYSSQTCPVCGTVEKKSSSQRWHSCKCGCELDRDVAAANIILQRSIEGETLPAGSAGLFAPALKNVHRPH